MNASRKIFCWSFKVSCFWCSGVLDCLGADFLLPSSFATSKNNLLFRIWLCGHIKLNYFLQHERSSLFMYLIFLNNKLHHEKQDVSVVLSLLMGKTGCFPFDGHENTWCSSTGRGVVITDNWSFGHYCFIVIWYDCFVDGNFSWFLSISFAILQFYSNYYIFVFRTCGFIFLNKRSSVTSIVKVHSFGMRLISHMQFGDHRVPGLFLWSIIHLRYHP